MKAGLVDCAPMSTLIRDIAFADLDRELATTRKVLARIPQPKFDFQPHQKSMSLGRLAMHVATLPQWMVDTLEKDELDLAKTDPPPKEAKDSAELLGTFEANVARVKAALTRVDDDSLSREWTLRQGERELYRAKRALVLRVWCLNHLVHHRGQLCVYLRLLNLPVPAVYFNSADEPEWVFE